MTLADTINDIVHSPLTALAAAVRRAVASFSADHSSVNEMEGLTLLSDKELARLGLTREDIGRDAFAHYLGQTPKSSSDGPSFETASFTNETGTRNYKLYVPGGRAGQMLPLIVMLHGSSQSPDDFAAGTRMNALAEELGFFVVYPEQPSSANRGKSWNWYQPQDQRRDEGEPSLIAGITKAAMRAHSIDPRRVYVAGLSSGGAAAVIMGRTYPDLFAAIGVHSGLAHGAAQGVLSAFSAMRNGAAGESHPVSIVPTIIFHGDKDVSVHPSNGDALVAQSTANFAELQSSVHHGQTPGGLAYSRTVHVDPSGLTICEYWLIHGGGHAWAGGSPSGSYTDPRGPDATREMARFFLEHRHAEAGASLAAE